MKLEDRIFKNIKAYFSIAENELRFRHRSKEDYYRGYHSGQFIAHANVAGQLGEIIEEQRAKRGKVKRTRTSILLYDPISRKSQTVSEPVYTLSVSWIRRKVLKAKALNMFNKYLDKIFDEHEANKNIRKEQ